MKAFKTLLAVALVLGISDILYAQDPGMTGTGKGKQFHKPSETGGAKIAMLIAADVILTEEMLSFRSCR